MDATPHMPKKPLAHLGTAKAQPVQAFSGTRLDDGPHLTG
ncbi:hypothetical protein SAMN04489738_3644 [Pseudarthrobacter chlorophenolicus]|nr:hypothetical protein SAMN04489738_3644 [Pseudarthrobacter chlorophenolicus]